MQKIDKKLLKDIRDQQEAIALAEASLQEAQGNFQLLIAQTLRAAGFPIRTSAICMDCGAMYSRAAKHDCPERPKG